MKQVTSHSPAAPSKLQFRAPSVRPTRYAYSAEMGKIALLCAMCAIASDSQTSDRVWAYALSHVDLAVVSVIVFAMSLAAVIACEVLDYNTRKDV